MHAAAWLLSVRRVLIWVPVRLLRAYQRVVSPLLPPACRFHPTCSEYAIQALERRGLFVGLALATWRVVRCNPWNAGGDDPVT